MHVNRIFTIWRKSGVKLFLFPTQGCSPERDQMTKSGEGIAHIWT